ncbi:N-acylneuraminate cytidylyltransferase [Sabethes cyaneus]|uniref:N-acylneuraminate cytidylyltransferase n=1 Tax=Sabethes cyaneus TaxID=53552 RepID=UPI00237E42F9|nr:N-acylneuraminate cytidylyltransferase [Sabethes cyaneus]
MRALERLEPFTTRRRQALNKINIALLAAVMLTLQMITSVLAILTLYHSPLVALTSPRCPKRHPNHSGNGSIAALILARGGSKSIPLKNLAKIGTKSLLVRTLEVLESFGEFDSIWVSTDDNRIGDAVQVAFPGDRIQLHFRSGEFARDQSTSIESTQEFLSKHPEIANVALVQCTSPFLRSQYLAEACRKFHRSVDCVFSAVRSFQLRWRMQPADEKMVPLNFDPRSRPRRQDWDGELVEAGMFYFARRSLILMEGIFQNEHCRVVEVNPKDALEIDDIDDLNLARIITEQTEDK